MFSNSCRGRDQSSRCLGDQDNKYWLRVRTGVVRRVKRASPPSLTSVLDLTIEPRGLVSSYRSPIFFHIFLDLKHTPCMCCIYCSNGLEITPSGINSRLPTSSLWRRRKEAASLVVIYPIESWAPLGFSPAFIASLYITSSDFAETRKKRGAFNYISWSLNCSIDVSECHDCSKHQHQQPICFDGLVLRGRSRFPHRSIVWHSR